METDAKLVSDALAGERSAYGELYDRYAPLIRAVCYDATGELAAAQDLTQEVFLRGYQKLARLRSAEKFAGWLVGIARQVCREWRRGRAKERRRYCSLDGVDPAVPHESDDGEIEQLREAMLQLTETERLALHAFYVLEQSPGQAHAALGLSRSGYYGVLQRARRRLGRIMGARWEAVR